MSRLLNLPRKRLFLLCSVASLLLAVTLAMSVRTDSQQFRALNQQAKNKMLERIEKSPDRALRIVGNDDCPLRIAEANVKEISGSQFTSLTGRTTDLETVSSVPEVRLVNTSGKTITGFVLAVRDPQSRSTRGFVQRTVSIAPGDTYIVKRDHFVDPERMAMDSENGSLRQALVQPKMDSEKYWIQHAVRSNSFITVGRVTFDDGDGWKINEGGEVK